MAESSENMSRNFIRRKKKFKRWQKVVSGLACAVVFCTTYALILPAITAEKESFCGIEEHIHTDACYKTETVCEKEELEKHTHIEDCYGYRKTLICEKAEAAAHTHSEECYGEETQEFTCNLTESQGHTHGGDCFGYVCGQEHEHTEECTGLICTLDETAGHTHDNTCVSSVKPLICGLNETAGHTHTDECYKQDEEKSLICGKEETAPDAVEHKHTEECYKKTLICTLDEHKHDLKCYSNPNADKNDTLWRGKLPATLSEVWADDLIAVASSQIGYAESRANYDVVDNELYGYTIYGAAYGYPYGDWCAMFIRWCLDEADIPTAADIENGVEVYFPMDVSCITTADKLRQLGYFRDALSEYTPKPGDVVLFATHKPEIPDHIGIVTELVYDNDGILTALRTIEGNLEDAVKECERRLDETAVYGYGVLPENPALTDGSVITVEKNIAPAIIEGDNGTYYLSCTLTVTAGNDGAADVRVEDSFTDYTAIKEIVGLSGAGIFAPTEEILADGAWTLAEGADVTQAAPGSAMIWNIGDMGAGEARRLTYTVSLADWFCSTYQPGTLSSTANAFSGEVLRGTVSRSYSPDAELALSKTAAVTANDDGSYTVSYNIDITAPAGNKITLTNLRIDDRFSGTDALSAADMLPDPDSISVTGSDGTLHNVSAGADGEANYVRTWNPAEPHATEELSDEYPVRAPYSAYFAGAEDGGVEAMWLYIGDMKPGTLKRVSYSITVPAEAVTNAEGAPLSVTDIVSVLDDENKGDGASVICSDSAVTELTANGEHIDSISLDVSIEFADNCRGSMPVAGSYTVALYTTLDEEGLPVGEPIKGTVIYTDEDVESFDKESETPYSPKSFRFNNLELNKSYYLFELDAAGKAAEPGEKLTLGGREFYPGYSAEEGAYSNAYSNEVILTENSASAVITNLSFAAELEVSFGNTSGVKYEKGVPGVYTFGIWNDEKHSGEPLETKTIEWAGAWDTAAAKSVYFENLTPGDTYFIYELDADKGNAPLENGDSVILRGSSFVVMYLASEDSVLPSDSVNEENANSGIAMAAFMLEPESSEENSNPNSTGMIGHGPAKISARNAGNSYSLPRTGGIGTAPYMFSGALLMGVSLFGILGLRLKKKKEVNT